MRSDRLISILLVWCLWFAPLAIHAMPECPNCHDCATTDVGHRHVPPQDGEPSPWMSHACCAPLAGVDQAALGIFAATRDRAIPAFFSSLRLLTRVADIFRPPRD